MMDKKMKLELKKKMMQQEDFPLIEAVYSSSYNAVGDEAMALAITKVNYASTELRLNYVAQLLPLSNEEPRRVGGVEINAGEKTVPYKIISQYIVEEFRGKFFDVIWLTREDIDLHERGAGSSTFKLTGIVIHYPDEI